MNRLAILPIAATTLFLACGETPIEPRGELEGPSLAKAPVVVSPGDDLQAVIDGLKPGGTILLAEGVYDLTGGGVTIDKRMTIEAAGDALIQGPAGNAFTVDGLKSGSVTFRGLRFEGGDRAIRARADIVVDECEFNNTGEGVRVSSGAIASVRNSSFKQVNTIGVFSFDAGTRVDVVNNTFEDLPRWGIQALSGGHLHVEDNTFNNCSLVAALCVSSFGSQFRPLETSAAVVGNEFNNTGSRAIHASRAEVLIKDNEIKQFGENAIRVTSVATVTGLDNEITGAGSGDIDCAVDAGSGTVRVIDNEISNGTGVGIFVRAGQFNIEGTACVSP